MKLDYVRKQLVDIPHMSYAEAEVITEFIFKNNLKNILELGFRHGVSTCYMAAALDELGEGEIITIDLNSARDAEPNIESLLAKLELQQFVNIFYEPTSYVWRLMKFIDEDPHPKFDFCYIDGAHSWFTDGLAFFLVDKLLFPGGWIIFDDLDWTFSNSPTLQHSNNVKLMPAEEIETPQIRKVYELLVKPHPSYGNFIDKNGWAYAQKISDNSSIDLKHLKKEIIYKSSHAELVNALLKLLGKIGLKF